MGRRRLEQFLRLPPADRALFVRSVLILGTARVALWLLPLKSARRLLARMARPISASPPSPERIAWAISRAERVVPRATCLPQALAAESLLYWADHPSVLRIGVVKTDEGRLVAHAWVECEGRIVVGELRDDLSSYTPLPPIPGVRP